MNKFKLTKMDNPIARPEDIPVYSHIQTCCFVKMSCIKSASERIELAKKMQREMAEESSVNVNSKLD